MIRELAFLDCKSDGITRRVKVRGLVDQDVIRVEEIRFNLANQRVIKNMLPQRFVQVLVFELHH